MIEEVYRYRTKDGVVHESESKATAHIIRKLENNIGPIIDDVNKELKIGHQLGPKTRLLILNRLVGTREKAKVLKEILDEMID